MPLEFWFWLVTNLKLFEKENHRTSLLAPHFPASEEEENHELHFENVIFAIFIYR